MKKEFIHYTYKRKSSKKQEENSFPLTFKHYFFKAYRAMDKHTGQSTENKLGFWAPAGNPKSKNKKVMEESKLKKEQDVWDTRKK